MRATQNLEGSIRREGNLLIGEGEAGMQVYDDVMKLAGTKTIKTSSIFRACGSTIVTALTAYLAYKFDNICIAAGAGVFGLMAAQQGKQAIDVCKQYAQNLEEAVSHGWNSKEELKKINWRYL